MFFNMLSSFKENLRDMLEYNDMSIAELARQTNIPLRSMQNYLYARSSMPPADYACRIARVLHTTVEELVGEGGDVAQDAETQQMQRLFPRLSKADKQAVIQLLRSITHRSAVK